MEELVTRTQLKREERWSCGRMRMEPLEIMLKIWNWHPQKAHVKRSKKKFWQLKSVIKRDHSSAELERRGEERSQVELCWQVRTLHFVEPVVSFSWPCKLDTKTSDTYTGPTDLPTSRFLLVVTIASLDFSADLLGVCLGVICVRVCFEADFLGVCLV